MIEGWDRRKPLGRAPRMRCGAETVHVEISVGPVEFKWISLPRDPGICAAPASQRPSLNPAWGIAPGLVGRG